MILRLLTWWKGSTIGAAFDISKRATKVGEDLYGNQYFEEKKPSLSGLKRRYVKYNGYAEASTVPAEWHSWLHHIVDYSPAEKADKAYDWQKPHKPNLTGSLAAYRPPGSLHNENQRPNVTGDYEAWSPE